MPKTTLAGRVVNALNAFTEQNNVDKTVNSTRGTANDFLRYGNRNKVLEQDWSQVEMSDQDMYTGYSYAAIKKRANRASALGKKFLYTESSKSIQEAAKKQDKDIEHPYLELVRKSKDFSRRKFWHDISVYLDLEGVYYLMAVRAIKVNSKGETQVGAIQKFQMLNPYQVRRVTKQSDGTLGGYIESKDGLYREIPKEMIIEVRLLNPFDNDTPFSMTDAAKESQYTMKQAGDYTRHSIKGNINAPGAISTGVELEDHVFDNFVNRIENHTKGEPLYGNGTGAVNWESMQIDLDKAGLDKINEINRSILFAVTGTSKTALGIEESGTTRDTSQTQKDNFTEDAVMPQVEDILDALNLDYRKWYPEWDDNEYEISLDNPLQSDRESELKDIEIRQSELDLRDALTAKGYEHEIAAKYAHGEIGLTELGEPTLEPEITDAEADAQVAAEAGLPTTSSSDSIDDGTQEPNTIDDDTNVPTVNSIDDVTANAGGGNPNHDKSGRFGTGSSTAVVTRKMVQKGDNEKKLKDARKRLKDKAAAEKSSQAESAKTEPLIGKNITPEQLSSVVKNLKLSKASRDGEGGSVGDSALGRIQEAMGYNAKPTVLSKGKFARQVKKADRLYRGVTKKSQANAFIKGDNFPGRGLWGSGTYASQDKQVAVNYSKTKAGGILTMGLSKSAKVITHDKLMSEMKSFNKKYGKGATAKDAAAVLSNPGRYAAMAGYDAISVPSPFGDSQTVILNRGATVVEGK